VAEPPGKLEYSNTTPSVAKLPPGNCAYPKIPPPILHTQIFKCVSGVIGG